MDRRSFLETCGAGLIGGLAAESAVGFPVKSPDGKAIFPYGTHIYREPHLPLEQLHHDLPLLKRLGFTMVKVQESWSSDESVEGGINLSTVSRVVSDARQNGLLVYFGITMEQAPAWLWRKYPDAKMEWDTGERQNDPTQYLLPSDGKPGPCWNHPGARGAAIRFIETVGREIGKYDNILVWNVWQEVTVDFDTQGHALGLCYCPNTLAAFRAWLKGKYSSLASLNKFWRTAYGDWEEVAPPRRFPKVPSMVDWHYFMTNVYLADALLWKAEAFRRTDPGRRKILTHTGGSQWGSSADWRLSKSVDVYGSSCYPGWGEYQDPDVSDEQRLRESAAPYSQVLDNALKWDYIRSCSATGEVWTAELQGGHAGGGVNPGRVPDPGDIRRWVMGALAGGVRGICFWNHRSEPFWDEAYGFGLLELEGDHTARAAEAGRIITAINEHAAELLSTGECPRASTAIVLDENLWSFVVGSGEPLKSTFVSNLRGIHRALWQEGIPVDFLDAGGVAHLGSHYKALIHPLPISLSSSAIESLRAYVHQGGTLISGPLPGRFDGYGFGMPGEMPRSLIELFGAGHAQVISLSGRRPHPSQNTLIPKDAQVHALRGVGDFAGAEVVPDAYLQFIELASGLPLLMYGQEIAGASNRFGAGRAFLVSTAIGPAINEAGGEANQAFLAALLKSAGVVPDRVGRLIRRRRTLGSKSAWFLFNPERSTVEEDLDLEDFKSASDLFGGSLGGEPSKPRVSVAPLDFACILLEK